MISHFTVSNGPFDKQCKSLMHCFRTSNLEALSKDSINSIDSILNSLKFNSCKFMSLMSVCFII